MSIEEAHKQLDVLNQKPTLPVKKAAESKR